MSSGTFLTCSRWRCPGAVAFARYLSLLGLATTLLAGAAAAHNLAPAYLELREQPGGEVTVLWKQSSIVPRGARLEPVLPCAAASAPEASALGAATVVRWTLACTSPLVGQRIAVDGLAESGIATLVRIALADGREIRAILSAGSPGLTVPPRERARSVLASYGALGVEHLFTGLDHVLFVAGLALLFGATRRLALAVTAFTVGHSVTLALAALGFVRLPQSAVEIAIAATIVALGASLARSGLAPPRPADGAPADSPPREPAFARRPSLLPFSFGLLHGLGFAGALGELGLPQHAIPLALFSFNVGIELAQLMLVAVLLAAARFAARLAPIALRHAPRLPSAHDAAATAIGSLGVFWCLERAAGWLIP